MKPLQLLTYDYVPDIAERRGPYREAHLALIEEWQADGRLVIAGGIGDPVYGGLLAFEVDDPTEVEEFVTADPYGEAGLVRSHRIETWNVVSSRPLDR